jgi:hypothetical protein
MTERPRFAHALRAFIATGAAAGVVRLRDGDRHAPVVDEDGIDSGVASVRACDALGG